MDLKSKYPGPSPQERIAYLTKHAQDHPDSGAANLIASQQSKEAKFFTGKSYDDPPA